MVLDATEILDARILIVDDKESNVLLLETMLHNVGYQNVSSTMRPKTVVGLHAEHKYDLILLDLQMPEMDGFEVMDGLKQLNPDSYLPVLVITAQPAHKLRALQAGAKDFITKPFELVEVQTRIHNMLEVRLLYQKLDNYNKVLEQTVLARTAELRASEARFKSFTELTSDWYWEQDAEGHFTQISGPALEMLGLSNTQANDGSDDADDDANKAEAGTSKRDTGIDPDISLAQFDSWDQAEGAQLRANIHARRPFLDLIYRKKQSDGSIQYLQVSGEPMFDQSSRFIGYRGIGMALDDRRRPDLAQQCFRAAMGLVEQGVLVIERASMHMLDANETLCRWLDYPRAQLLALNLEQIHLGQIDALAHNFDRLLAGQAVPPDNIHLRGRQSLCISAHIEWHVLHVEQQSVIVGIINASAELAQMEQIALAAAPAQEPHPIGTLIRRATS